jgi:hypothetical protein
MPKSSKCAELGGAIERDGKFFCLSFSTFWTLSPLQWYQPTWHQKIWNRYSRACRIFKDWATSWAPGHWTFRSIRGSLLRIIFPAASMEVSHRAFL